MKTAILGGSFNPVHNGHIALANAVLNQLPYNKILLIPASQPLHKRNLQMVKAHHRLEMVKLATESQKDLIVSDCELRREGRSYTIDTIKYLYRTLEFEGKLGLIIGDDWIDGFSSWKDAEELITLVDIVLARRESASVDFSYPCTYLKNDIITVSSTEIRDKLAKSESINTLVPQNVVDYIDIHGLYKTNK